MDFFVDGIKVLASVSLNNCKTINDPSVYDNEEEYRYRRLLNFRVQTIPKKSGLLEFIVDCRKPDLAYSIRNMEHLFTYTTTKPFPYGITYAVFGSKNTTAASYRIRDGNNFESKIISILDNAFHKLTDYRLYSPSLTAERVTTQA